MSVFDECADLVLEREPAVRRVGLGDVWDALLVNDDTPSRRVLLATVSSLALYMDESGLRVGPSP